MPEFKQNFLDHYEELTDIETFKEYCLKPVKKSIRVNTLKISVKDFKIDLKLKKVPWTDFGFYIEEERIGLGNLPEHQLGYFYMQESASMIPPLVLNPKNEVILDMCASPGSKTTELAQLMNNKGLIIANDYKIIRLKSLSINLQRCGVSNTVVSLMEGRFFKNQNFDKILVDAPCSGTGTIRKSLRTLKEWNLNTVKKIAGIQRQLIKTAFENLKENGTMVYSTCSLEPEENEAIINHLLETYENAKLEKINLNLKSSKPILEYKNNKYSSEINKCLRLWPQDNDTDGFFVAKIKKD